jgi:uncharacterized protein YjiK
MRPLILSLLLFGIITDAKLTAQSSILGRFDFSGKNSTVRKLSAELAEISGLALSSEGHVYAHDDERGRMYVLEPLTGKLIRNFDLGRGLLREDFEGVAVVGQRIWLVNSNGTLFEFSDPGDDGKAAYTTHRTALSGRNDVEGLCYDPVKNELLLACKEYAGTGNAGDRAVYAFSLTNRTLNRTPRFVLTRKQLSRMTDTRNNGFSGIERHPESGNFFLISAKGQYIVELSPDGKILAHARFPKKAHPQPEGITFLRGGELVIADEGKKHGTLTIYPPKRR